MSKYELLQCPFCGGDAVLNEDSGMFRIGCENEACFAYVDPSNPIVYISEEYAIRAWNMRTSPTTQAEKERG